MARNWNIDADALAERYREVRRTTETLCEPLETEDYVVQSMPDASPAKWHLAHSTWFFERFILQEHFERESVDERYNYLFNSYYNAAGDQWSRPERGLLSRPTVAEIEDYRRAVDTRMADLLATDGQARRQEVAELVELGLNHEQQHQELLVTDTKHMFGQNPLHPEIIPGPETSGRDARATTSGRDARATTSGRDARAKSTLPDRLGLGEDLQWRRFQKDTYEIGWDGDTFCFDNEKPRHERLLHGFELAHRPVTCGEWLAFMEDGGYEDSQLWLSDGWAAARDNDWTGPMYWTKKDGRWCIYTLGGLRPVDPREPACHVSYYEADAFANWADARLPTEAEWEVASRAVAVEGHFLDPDRRHPAAAPKAKDGDQPFERMFGDMWEWTASDYAPYPGFQPWEGMVGEYNGKFMCNQRVLRGGSCATPASHIRRTYRNFFYPHSRWQFTGVRLARDA